MSKLLLLILALFVLVALYVWGNVIAQADHRAQIREQARIAYLDKMGMNR